MSETFAYINFSESMLNETESKTSFIKNIYKKYSNPKEYFQVKEQKINEIFGFDIKIPITKEEAIQDKQRFEYVLYRTLETAATENISIIRIDNYYDVFLKDVSVSNGMHIFPFFIFQIINSIYVDLENVNIGIVDSDRRLTTVLLEILYNKVDNLSLITKNKKSYKYIEEQELGVEILDYKKSSFKNIDILIETSNLNDNYDYAYKRGSVLIYLGENIYRYNEIMYRRQDVKFIHKCDINMQNKVYDIIDIEIFSYIKCKKFKYILENGFNNSFTQEVLSFIETSKMKIKNIHE